MVSFGTMHTSFICLFIEIRTSSVSHDFVIEIEKVSTTSMENGIIRILDENKLELLSLKEGVYI